MTVAAPTPCLVADVAVRRGARVDRLAWSVLEAAGLHRASESTIRAMMDKNGLAYVQLSPGRRVILEGDVLPTSRSSADDGRGVLARCFRDRRWLWLSEIADALGVHVASLLRLVHAADLPAKRAGEYWRVDRDTLVRWLLRRRVPPSWEVAA